MKQGPFFLILRLILIGSLLVGLLLIWVSFQSFETLAFLLNNLASDGELESFDLFLYQTLKLPLVVIGIALVLISGTILFRWEKTKLWVGKYPAVVKHFLLALGNDRRTFLKDTKTGIMSQGRLIHITLFGTMLLAAVTRLANLDAYLGHDEAYMYNAFASRSFWHIVTNYHLPNNHVFLSLTMKIVTGLLGNHVWTLRLPTIIAGILMVPAAYFFARRFYSKETAVVSAILVAVFPILVQYSVLARGYIIVGLVTLLLFTLGDYVRLNRNRFAWLLIVLLSTLGFYTIPIMLFPFGALYLWLLVSWALEDTRSYASKFDFLKDWLGTGISAALLTIILYTPIIIYSFDRFFGNGFIAPVEWEVFPETIWTRLRNTWIEWTLSIPVWIVLLGVLGLLVSLVFHKRFSGQKFPPQVAFILWIVTLLLLRRPDMLPRFWLFLAAPLLVWSAAGIIEPLKRIPLDLGKGWDPAQVAVASISILALVYGLLTLPSLPSHMGKKDDMEKATIYLKDVIRKSDLVTASTARLPALRYYFNYYEIPPGYIRQSGDFQRAFIIVDENKFESLASIAPQLSLDIPAIDMETVELVYQHGDCKIYEAYPIQ